MNKRAMVIIFLIAAIITSLCPAAEAASKKKERAASQKSAYKAPDTKKFPLLKGNYWVYDTAIRVHNEANPEKPIEAKITLKMEVLEAYACKNFIAALVKGYPGNLSWYENGREDSKAVIIYSQPDGYFVATVEERINEIIEKFQNGKFSEKDLSKLADWQIIQLPLEVGKTYFSDPSDTETTYRWQVAEKVQMDVTGIPGLKDRKTATTYTLMYRTNPDHTIIGFTPGIGITHYTYQHHGTVSDVDAKLVEVNLNQ